MATAKQIMEKAISYIGVKESPANSNNVIFNTDYYGHAVHDVNASWCCAFVWDIFRMCGASDLFFNGDKTAYCPSVYTWAKNKGMLVDKNKGQYGDIVLFDWNNNNVPDHIGFIDYKNSNGSYSTIEGNTSVGNNSNGGEVMRRTRYQSNILAIVRPKYEAVSTSTQSATTSVGVHGNDIIKQGQKYAVEFVGKNITIDGVRGSETKKMGIKVLQHAINLDYGKNIPVDGDWGSLSAKALGSHYVIHGETQYLVTAVEILLMLKGYNSGGVEVKGIFGSNLKKCVLQYQEDHNLTKDAKVGKVTFASLIS